MKKKKTENYICPQSVTMLPRGIICLKSLLLLICKINQNISFSVFFPKLYYLYANIGLNPEGKYQRKTKKCLLKNQKIFTIRYKRKSFLIGTDKQ